MINKEIQWLVHSSILKCVMSPYSSPIMFIGRMNSHLKRTVTDFRFFNSRLQRVKWPFP